MFMLASVILAKGLLRRLKTLALAFMRQDFALWERWPVAFLDLASKGK